MWVRRRLHAVAFAGVVAVLFGVAPAQPPGPPPPLPPLPPPAAGASPAPAGDVPDHQPSPPRFAVAPFENRSGARTLDWLIAAAPFEISEKTEDVLGLEPTGGALHVGKDPVAPQAAAVAAFGAARAAPWVITGWVERPRWQLRIAIALWKVTGRTAAVVAETERTGEMKAYHALLGEALADAWARGGVAVDAERRQRLARPLAADLYAVNLMGRGLGHLTGAIGGAPNLKAAEHDLERAVFIDPKCFEAQRLLGELYGLLAADPKAPEAARLASRAAGKAAYASDLAPDDIASLRTAAAAAARAGKHEVARDLARRLVVRKPWDLEARHAYGAALWHTGDVDRAERQLAQVTAHRPDHLPARRVLVLIHASRGDTRGLVGELEAIAARAPADLEVKADLATAYGSIEQWDRAAAALEAIAAARAPDLALLVRIGDARRRMNDLPGALAAYGRAARLAPDSSYPGFAAAQALFDAGRLAEAAAAYTGLQRFRDDAPAAQQALAVIALAQGRPGEAAWTMRIAVRDAPRSLPGWRTLAAAELARKDAPQALAVLDRALWAWPDDAELLYLAGVGRAMIGDRPGARGSLGKALAAAPGHAAARDALALLDGGGAVVLRGTPELVRPWGDARAIDQALARYAAAAEGMAAARAAYQHQLLSMLGVLGEGPYAPVKPATKVRTCPVTRIAPMWDAARRARTRLERLGADLELAHRFVARHDELGATAALLPNARAQVAAMKRSFRTALADAGELRAEWERSLLPALRLVGCTDRLLAAALADPERYRVIRDDRPADPPVQQAPRPRPRATFYVDNTRCADPVDVLIDGAPVGQVAPGRRSALVADGGERTLCLIVPGAARCGDRGTVRQVYLHDGWSATMHCPR
ncbi:MAG TPA: tetratricopeptide repeat protein [Kofleriaceae bacterium]|nr:tetratricopeptide repeat protein [Kofleriaceae bacterium]